MKIYIVMEQVKFLNFFKKEGSPDGNSENIEVFVLTCIIKIPWMSLMYPSYHQKFCISVQAVAVRGRVIQCTVCERPAEVVCYTCLITCYCSEECQVRKTFHRGSTLDM
jgi:hypothetical protein